jgi:hypothetical protein
MWPRTRANRLADELAQTNQLLRQLLATLAAAGLPIAPVQSRPPLPVGHRPRTDKDIEYMTPGKRLERQIAQAQQEGRWLGPTPSAPAHQRPPHQNTWPSPPVGTAGVNRNL